MDVRPINKNDVPFIEEFHNKYNKHQLDFSNSLFHGICENEGGEIIAYGAVKEFHECIISVDKSKTTKEKYEAIKELLGASIYLAGLKGETTLYAFAEEEFSALLKKHFGFTEIPEKLLGIRVKNGA